MDQEILNRCLASIKKAAEDGDDEMAHSEEDNLRALFLDSLLKDPKYAEQVMQILSTDDTDFARWCA